MGGCVRDVGGRMGGWMTGWVERQTPILE